MTATDTRLYLEGHRRVRGWRTDDGYVAVCECGWTSDPVASARAAGAAHDEHCRPIDRDNLAAVVIEQDAVELPDEPDSVDHLPAPYNSFPDGY